MVVVAHRVTPRARYYCMPLIKGSIRRDIMKEVIIAQEVFVIVA
jgi:hypothetical protein